MAAITNTYSPYDSRTIDTATTFGTTPATVTTSAAFGSVLDIGLSHMLFDVMVDLSTILATAGNGHIVCVQGSNSATFASGNFTLAALPVGDVLVTGNDADNVGDGRYIISGSNAQEGTLFRYLRVYLVQVGTASTIVNAAYLCARQNP